MTGARGATSRRAAERRAPAARTAIVAAMRAELAPALRRAAAARPELLPLCTGTGREAAARAAAGLLARGDVGALLVLGVAGALAPGLAEGAVLVAEEIRDEDGIAPPPDPALVARALALPGTEGGICLSVPRVLGTAAEKGAAWRRLATARPAVVDLESATLARAAAASGVPYLVLRAVCDTADEDLPFDAERCSDAGGAVRPARVVRGALLRPHSLPRLWELRRRVERAAERLAECALALLGGRAR